MSGPCPEAHQTCVDHVWETINKANIFIQSLNVIKWTSPRSQRNTKETNQPSNQRNKIYHLQMQDFYNKPIQLND